jgi:hypothetical protein
MKKPDLHRGYVIRPAEINGYKLEKYYCECGCKNFYWHYIKITGKVSRK